MSTVIVINDDYCYNNVAYNITLTSWYAMLFSFEMIFTVGVLVALALMHKHIIPVRYYRDRYVKYVPWVTQFLVFVSLGRNLATFVKNDELPFCGLEQFAVCTKLTSEVTNGFFKFFAVLNYGAAIVAAILAEYYKVVVVEFIAYRPMPFEWTKASLKNQVQRFATAVAEQSAILITAVFSPGMVLLEVIPYTAACVVDSKLKLVIANAITHFTMFMLVIAAAVYDIYDKAESKPKTYFAAVCFVATGIVLFFTQIFASSGNEQMWQIWTFSVGYPPLVSLCGKMFVVMEQFGSTYFSVANDSAFSAKIPTWCVADTVMRSLTQKKEGTVRGEWGSNEHSLSFESALDAMGTSLDTIFSQFCWNDIKTAVNSEMQYRTQAFGSYGESERAMLALTTILPRRPWNLRDFIFGRTQLFDRLHIVMEKMSKKTQQDWEEQYETRLTPFLTLVYIALLQQPIVSETHLLLKRYMYDEGFMNWFLVHRGPPQDPSDEWNPRGSELYPVRFRSFFWGFSNLSDLSCGINDGIAVVSFISELPSNYHAPRSISHVVSQSWLADGRGDVLCCPGCSLAVDMVMEDTPLAGAVLVLKNAIGADRNTAIQTTTTVVPL